MARNKSAGGRKLSLKALLPLAMMAINYKIDYTSEHTIKVVRALFMVSLTLVNIGMHIVKARIKSANDVKRTVRIPSEAADGKPEVKTVLEYDTDEIDKLNVQSMLGWAVSWGLHYFAKVNPPLLMQLLIQPMTLWDAPVFKVHVLGHADDEDPCQRPWAVTGVLEQASRMGAAWEAREKAMQARAEKMSRGIVKKAPKQLKEKAGKKGK